MRLQVLRLGSMVEDSLYLARAVLAGPNLELPPRCGLRTTALHDPERGIRGEVKGRTLLTHAEEEFQEQGLALSFAWQPHPSNRGPSFSMNHAVGATASGGMDALLRPIVMEGLVPPAVGRSLQQRWPMVWRS